MDYPQSTLVPVKGKLYVSVTVPKQLEHLFKQKQIRLSTGTSDKKESQKRQHRLASRIYARFDKAQNSERDQSIEQVHVFLQALCDALDYKFDVRQTLSKLDNDSRELISKLDNMTTQMMWENPDVGELSPKYQRIEQMVLDYYHDDIQWYADLFRKPESRVGAPAKFSLSKSDEPAPSHACVSKLADTYADARNWDRLKSKDAARRQIKKFVSCVGDLEAREIQKQHAYAFASALQSEGKAQKTIASHVSAVSAMLTWCEQNALIDQSPFSNLKLANYGKKKSSWLPLSSDELHALFAQDMDEQDRLLLSILITTGMRLAPCVREVVRCSTFPLFLRWAG